MKKLFAIIGGIVMFLAAAAAALFYLKKKGIIEFDCPCKMDESDDYTCDCGCEQQPDENKEESAGQPAEEKKDEPKEKESFFDRFSADKFQEKETEEPADGEPQFKSGFSASDFKI